jgi:ABC-type uncharacterized transport system involved in gliding motility auxiliary subunit
MREWMRRLAIPLGVAGLAALALAAVVWLLTRELDIRTEALLGVGVVLLALSVVGRPEMFRAALTGRTARYGSNAGIVVVAFLGILVLLNFLSDRHHRRVDLTEAGEYTLSPQTIQILSQLAEPVKVTAFFAKGDYREQDLEDLLSEYSYHTAKISYEFVDLDVQPFVAQQYEIGSYGTIVFESGGRRQDIFTVDEQEITTAILKVSRETQKVVYFLTGHGERDSGGYDEEGYSEARDYLEKDNYIVRTVNLAISNTVPVDASVLIVAAPRTALLEEESTAIRTYLESGGRALVMQEPGDEPVLSDVLAEWGVGYGDDVIIDPERALLGANPFAPVVDTFSYSEITRDLPGVVIITARSVTSTVEQTEKDVSTVALVESSDSSWGETDFEALSNQEAGYDEGVDSPGPLAMLMSVEEYGQGDSPIGARLVVCGDSDFAANSNLMMGGNVDLLLNSVNWLAEEEALISIRPEPPASRMLILSPGEARFLQLSSVVFLPALVLMVGAAMWWRRR